MKWPLLVATLLILLTSACTNDGITARESTTGPGQNTTAAVTLAKPEQENIRVESAFCDNCPNKTVQEQEQTDSMQSPCPQSDVTHCTEPCSDCPRLTGTPCDKAATGQCPKTPKGPCPAASMNQCPSRINKG